MLSNSPLLLRRLCAGCPDPIPEPPAHKTKITHTTHHQTTSQITLQSSHNTPQLSCPSTSCIQSPICIPSPHNLILILPHSTLPNPHFTQALKAKQTATDSGTYLYLAVLDDGCADAALLLRPQPWLGSRADPGSNRGPDLARYRAPATDRVRNCRSCKRGMQWEAMGRVQDAGWVAGVTCKIATMALKILVEAPGFRCSSSCSQKCRIGRSDGTAAIQADSWMTPISSVHHMAHASGP